MRIFVLELDDSLNLEYDLPDGFVIVASSHSAARKLAFERSKVHDRKLGDDRWLDPKRSSCKEVRAGVKGRIVLESVLHG